MSDKYSKDDMRRAYQLKKNLEEMIRSKITSWKDANETWKHHYPDLTLEEVEEWKKKN